MVHFPICNSVIQTEYPRKGKAYQIRVGYTASYQTRPRLEGKKKKAAARLFPDNRGGYLTRLTMYMAQYYAPRHGRPGIKLDNLACTMVGRFVVNNQSWGFCTPKVVQRRKEKWLLALSWRPSALHYSPSPMRKKLMVAARRSP